MVNPAAAKQVRRLAVTDILLAAQERDTGTKSSLDLDDLPALVALGHERPLRVRLTDSGSMRKALLFYQSHLKQTVGDAIARAAGSVRCRIRHPGEGLR